MLTKTAKKQISIQSQKETGKAQTHLQTMFKSSVQHSNAEPHVFYKTLIWYLWTKERKEKKNLLFLLFGEIILESLKKLGIAKSSSCR